MPNFMPCRQYVPNIPQSSLSQISIDIPDLFGYWPPHVRHAARLWHGLPLGHSAFFFSAPIWQHKNKSVEFISLQTCLKIGQLFMHSVVRTLVIDTGALSQAAGASVVLVIRTRLVMCWAAQVQFCMTCFFFSLSPEGVKLSGLGARLSTNSASSCQAGRSC